MKKLVIGIIIIMIILLSGTMIFFFIRNNENIQNINDDYSNIESKTTIENVTKIICKHIYEENASQKEDLYNIINQDKINKIIELLENQELNKLYENTSEENYIEIKIYNNEEEKQLTIYENNNIKLSETEYQVNSELYKDLISILNPTYYLHNSNLELPSEEKCITMQEKALSGLSENEMKEINTKLRNAHTTMEILLINGTKNLKQSNSIYWNLYNEAEIITEPTGEELEFSKDSCFRAVANNIRDIANILKDKETKEIFNSIYDKLNKAMENKDISELFKIHEQIHDFDYWIINYPAYFDNAPAPDWEGIETYFGTKM